MDASSKNIERYVELKNWVTTENIQKLLHIQKPYHSSFHYTVGVYLKLLEKQM